MEWNGGLSDTIEECDLLLALLYGGDTMGDIEKWRYIKSIIIIIIIY